MVSDDGCFVPFKTTSLENQRSDGRRVKRYIPVAYTTVVLALKTRDVTRLQVQAINPGT